MRDMLDHAYRNNYAVGGFDLVSLDFLEAILDAAEACRSPVILSLAESHFEHYDFELAMAATEKAARRAQVPVAIHLDHGASPDSAVRAINLGCNGIMVDSSNEAFPVNVTHTRKIVEIAHRCGITVEGELGYVAGIEGEDAEKHPGEAVYTSVAEAKAYAERVRRVVTGWAVSDAAKYRFCRIVEFAHPKVIESYRDHPDHVAFANDFFRPLAHDRASIDFVGADTGLLAQPTVVPRQMQG